MDNPTYDERIGVGPLAMTMNKHENNFQKPLYSNAGPGSPNITNPPTQNMYEGLYSESTMASETLYENTHSSVPGTLTNGGGQANGGMRGGTTSEAVYDVPPDVDNVGSDNCYSALGPVDYSTLQPHISKATQQQQQQLPSNDDGYSHLQH